MEIPWFTALLLALAQGATEFLPVSSSAHLVIVSKLCKLEHLPLTFVVTVHVGTLLAVLIYYRRDVRDFFRAIFHPALEVEGRGEANTGARRLFWMLLVASLPAGFAGFVLADLVDQVFSSPLAAGVALLFTATFLWLADRCHGDRNPDKLSYLDALLVGVGQAIAIMPGISRSGTTLWAARARKLSPGWAPRFSFLMSIPAIAGAGLLEAKDMLENPPAASELITYGLAGLVAAAVGYASIYLVIDSVKHGSLFKRFGYYCVGLSVITITLSLTGYLG